MSQVPIVADLQPGFHKMFEIYENPPFSYQRTIDSTAVARRGRLFRLASDADSGVVTERSFGTLAASRIGPAGAFGGRSDKIPALRPAPMIVYTASTKERSNL